MNLYFEFWRTANLTKLSTFKRSSNNRSLNMKVSKESSELLEPDVAVGVQGGFMSLSVSTVASTSYFRVVEGIIATLLRLNACMATSTTCLCAHASENLATISRSCAVKPFQHVFQSLPTRWPRKLKHTMKIRTHPGLISVPVQSLCGCVYFICQQASRCRIVLVVFGIYYLLPGHYPGLQYFGIW